MISRAGITQWQSVTLPRSKRRFESCFPLHPIFIIAMENFLGLPLSKPIKTQRAPIKIQLPKSSIQEKISLGKCQHIEIKKAKISDTEKILDLINQNAAKNLLLPRGPRYLFENIRDFSVAVDTGVSVQTNGDKQEIRHPIVACASLHVLWQDIAEIRSLSISTDYQRQGIGTLLIESMKQEAKKLGIKQLYTFTLTQKFFELVGFKKENFEKLPAKIWDECCRCPKYFDCDEICMRFDLEPKLRVIR